MEGELIRVQPDRITVRSARGFRAESNVDIVVAPETNIFTAYGGFVAKEGLTPGQIVRVWFTERPRRSPTPVAAVITLASKTPGEGF
jgi:hypothetical protein